MAENTAGVLTIEQELEIVKSKLFSMQILQNDENTLDLSRMGQDLDDFSPGSALAGSKYQLKPTSCTIDSLKEELMLKDELLAVFRDQENIYHVQLEESHSRIQQLEIDLAYCISQNKLAYAEVQKLTKILNQNGTTFKSLSELDMLKSKNLKLREDLGKVEDLNVILRNKIEDFEGKYGELIKEMSNARSNDENSGWAPNINSEPAGMENKLREENQQLIRRVGELERAGENGGALREIIRELGVKNEKEVYKRVLYLNEFYYQYKDMRKFVKKSIEIISKRLGKESLGLDEALDYIISIDS